MYFQPLNCPGIHRDWDKSSDPHPMLCGIYYGGQRLEDRNSKK